MTERLTDRLVKKLPSPAAGNAVVFDDVIKGFGVRITAAGAKAFVLKYRRRSDGLRRLLTIGAFPDWTVLAAREEAKALKREIDRGGDPFRDRREAPLKNLEQRIAGKALAFLNQNLEPACYLYRHYHPSGDLLYVGVSLDAVERQRRHMKGAGWHNMICRIVIEPFETRGQALEAEQIAIKSEFPKFNAIHNGRDLFREITTFTRGLGYGPVMPARGRPHNPNSLGMK